MMSFCLKNYKLWKFTDHLAIFCSIMLTSSETLVTKDKWGKSLEISYDCLVFAPAPASIDDFKRGGSF